MHCYFFHFKIKIGRKFYFSLLTVAAIFSFASITTQNNITCEHELRFRAEDYIDSLQIKCESRKRVNAAASRSMNNITLLLAEEAYRKGLESLRVEILPLIIETSKSTINQTLPRIPQNTQERITSLEVGQDIHIFHRIFNEVRKANDNVSRVHLNASSILVSTRENFTITHQDEIYLKMKICINRWTVDKIQKNGNNLTEENCHPSKQNVEIGSNFLLKVVKKLIVQDEKFLDEIEESDRKILELESNKKDENLN